MTLNWSDLLQIRDQIPVDRLEIKLETPCSTLPVIGVSPLSMSDRRFRGWFKISPQQFLHTFADPQNGVRFNRFCWASSDGAFARALTLDPFFEVGTVEIPPAELLPDGCTHDWQSIVRMAKELGGRKFDMREWDAERVVAYDRFAFYFRKTSTAPLEPPFCIRVLPQEDWLGHQ